MSFDPERPAKNNGMITSSIKFKQNQLLTTDHEGTFEDYGDLANKKA
jgi:hypothetical protein